MERLSHIDEWRQYASEQRSHGRHVALVPTMGALHEGHASLFRAARAKGDVVMATIFVNPRQFHDEADLLTYPRTPEADRTMAEANGVDCLVEPSWATIWPDYPEATATTVSVRGLGDSLEGVGRPGHFNGVASVVTKLLSITGPCRAYFGEKDFQQLAVIRQLVRDLALDADVVSCAIVRDENGLALSSRNRQLSGDGRRRAQALSRALSLALARPARASDQRHLLRETLQQSGVATVYAEIVDPLTLMASRDDEVGERRALLAAIIDGVRLIDNGPVTLMADGN